MHGLAGADDAVDVAKLFMLFVFLISCTFIATTSIGAGESPRPPPPPPVNKLRILQRPRNVAIAATPAAARDATIVILSIAI